MLARLDFRVLLLVLAPLYAAAVVVTELAGAADAAYHGGDFINQWSAARLVLGGRFSAIYDPDAFMAFQHTIVPTDIGLRLWAYPPHSLLLIWPFGLLGYYPALILWSLVGLAVLAWGARRMGFNAVETALILLSPASVTCLQLGQTGNVAVGLMLLALAARNGNERASVVAAALLTVKPQIGFLLPVLWVAERRWRAILATAALAVAFMLLSVAVFGWDVWRGYLWQTLPTLDQLERHGEGPFTLMIPSVFMAFRILLGDDRLASTLHLLFAAVVGAYFIWRLARVQDPVAARAMLLVTAVLVTPYIHSYDLNLLLCGALLVARLYPGKTGISLLVAIAFAMPELVRWLNFAAFPVAPLLILPLLLLAGQGTMRPAAKGESSAAA